MEGRSWTLTKVAVFGSMVLLLAVAVFYVYHSYTDAPKPWNPGALTVHWSDVKYLTGQDEQIKGFLFQYGVNNNTSRDYEVHKEAVTIMTSTKDGEDSLIPADTNYSLGRDSFSYPLVKPVSLRLGLTVSATLGKMLRIALMSTREI